MKNKDLLKMVRKIKQLTKAIFLAIVIGIIVMGISLFNSQNMEMLILVFAILLVVVASTAEKMR